MHWPNKSSKLAFFLGVCLGMGVLLLLGFTLQPQSDGGTPAGLRSAYREIYLDLVARAYEADSSLDLDMVLGPGWTPELSRTTLQTLADKTSPSDHTSIVRLRSLAQALDITIVINETQYEPMPDATLVSSSPVSALRSILRVSGLVVLLLAIALAILFFLSNTSQVSYPKARRGPDIAARTYKYRIQPASWPDVEALPMIQFLTTYQQGDKNYDPSVAIETEDGKFLGECGVGITSTLPKGKAELVPAIEVWMFDKSDIQTVTHVFLSDFVKTDEELKAKITKKNPYSVPQAEQIITLQTAALTLRAKVVNAGYVIEGPHLNAYFEKLTLEVAIWSHSTE